jgi:hypothetical protein
LQASPSLKIGLLSDEDAQGHKDRLPRLEASREKVAAWFDGQLPS